MKITFFPIRSDTQLSLSKDGDVLTINGEGFDFSALPDGAILPREAVATDWLTSDVERINGTIHLSLILPHGADAPPEERFPAPQEITRNGLIPLAI